MGQKSDNVGRSVMASQAGMALDRCGLLSPQPCETPSRRVRLSEPRDLCVQSGENTNNSSLSDTLYEKR